jgi:hypothetical protein
LTNPLGLEPVVAAIVDAATVGAAESIVNVCVVTGDWTLSALSVALDDTVYEPSAGKFAAGKPYTQLDVPVARVQTWLGLENALPFQ